MSDRLPWAKFSWTAWDTDVELAMCSMGAQGLWMRLLCMAAKEDGIVAVAGKAPSVEDLAYLTRQTIEDINRWLAELEARDVFSRDGKGRIYSRRMTRDARNSRRNQQNGKKGGNPSLRKDEGNSDWDNPQAPDGLKADKEEEKNKKENPLTPKGDDLFGGEGGEVEQPPTDDVHEAFDLWNAMAPGLGLPVAKDLTETRRRAIRKRLAVVGLPGWREALAAVGRSKLCRGDNDRGWKADLDFVCQAKSFTKLREGSYGADAKPPTSAIITPICTFTGPAALRKTVVDEIDESFAVKFIDPAGWREADRTLIVRNAYADVEVRRELRQWLIRMKVCVEVAGQTGAGRAA